MSRLLILLFALALLPASAFDFEKWVDDLGNKQMERWKKEKIQTLARDRDPEARLEALNGLSYTDDDAVMAFRRRAVRPRSRVRQAAASKLWSAEKRAEPYRPQLEKALEDSDPNVVAYAAGALQAIGMKEADLAPARRRVLAAPEASVSSRFYAARNLVGFEPPRKLVEPMIGYLENNTHNYTGSVTDKNRKNVSSRRMRSSGW
jgi:HEAT repeat protein